MTANRRQILRRIQRETGQNLRQIIRDNRGLTAYDIARRYLARSEMAIAPAEAVAA